MLSPDCTERRTRESRRAGAKATARTARRGAAQGAMAEMAVDAEQAQSFDPSEPWDAVSAEALMRLYESDEGNLGRPAARARSSDAGGRAGSGKTGPRVLEAGGIDRTWLEVHLSRLAKRLQRSVARAAPVRTLAALSDRLDAIEQRFGSALGRVAQRTDLEGLKSIEAEVMELAAQLLAARDRLDRIGAVDEEVRTVAQRLDEAGERRAAALEKLMRDCLAEWRAGEERTAGALHNLEEAIGRLGDSVDAMEASRPAPDLTVPSLPAADLGPSPNAAMPELRAFGASETKPAARYVHPPLDAADYAPRRTVPAATPPGESALAEAGIGTLPASAVTWSLPQHAGEDGLARARASLAAGGWEMELQSGFSKTPDVPPGSASPGGAGRPEPDASRRASLGLLLAAGAAVLASSTYLIYQAVVAPILPATRPAATEPGPQAVGGDPELPGGRRG
jgi:hypothetical protein